MPENEEEEEVTTGPGEKYDPPPVIQISYMEGSPPPPPTPPAPAAKFAFITVGIASILFSIKCLIEIFGGGLL